MTFWDAVCAHPILSIVALSILCSCAVEILRTFMGYTDD